MTLGLSVAYATTFWIADAWHFELNQASNGGGGSSARMHLGSSRSDAQAWPAARLVAQRHDEWMTHARVPGHGADGY